MSSSRVRFAFVSAVLATAIAGGGASPAAARDARAQGESALAEARAILAGKRAGGGGRELTLVLRDLASSRGALSRRDRRAADEILKRPSDADDIDGDGQFGAFWTVEEEAPVCSAHFCVHYVGTTNHAPDMTDEGGEADVPDYVENMLDVFEFVYARENGPAPAGLGWPAVPPDGTLGGDAKMDVYIADIGDKGVYGYVAPDTNQPDDGSKTSYQVMDDDYAEFAGETSLKVTAAHEYNHALQFGAQAKMDTWAFEATATWMEDMVYPAINDYFQYVGDWANLLRVPITTWNGTEGDPLENYQYGSGVWNHYLAKRFGAATVRNVWTQAVDGEDALTSYDRAIPLGQDTSFSEAFGGFAAALAEWKASTAKFPDGPSYPHFRRAGTMTVGSTTAAVQTLDHASYALLNVVGATGSTSPIQLTANFPAGVSGAIALVGGPGTSGTASPVREVIGETFDGGPVSVTLKPPITSPRVTAVLVNTDRATDGRDEAGDPVWVNDDVQVTARAVRTGVAQVAGGTVAFTAAPGAANKLTVSQATSTYRFKDTASPITPGAGCVAVTTNEVTCTSSTATALSVSTGDGNDTVTSTASRATRFDGGTGADTITGGTGADTLTGGDGGDILGGGGGIDTVSYATRAGAVTVDLDGVRDDGNGLDSTTVSLRDNAKADIENIVGGAGADTLTGDADANVLDGGGGGDILSGMAGADTATYASRSLAVTVDIDGVRDDGNADDNPTVTSRDNVKTDMENITGGSGADTLRAVLASTVVNVLTGGAGNDKLKTREGQAATDRIFCGSGTDAYDKDGADTASLCETAAVLP